MPSTERKTGFGARVNWPVNRVLHVLACRLRPGDVRFSQGGPPGYTRIKSCRDSIDLGQKQHQAHLPLLDLYETASSVRDRLSTLSRPLKELSQ